VIEAAASGAIDDHCRTIKKLHSLPPRTLFLGALLRVSRSGSHPQKASRRTISMLITAE
jgi:hypothetical protein